MGDKIIKSPQIRFKGFTDDWEQRKLGDYVKIISGEAPSKFHEGNCNYVKVDDLNYAFKTVINTQNKVSEHKTVSKVKKGSVIFPKRGAAILTNKVRILGIDSYMDTNMMALSSDILDSDFLYIMISKEGLYKIADTSTIPQINNKHIEPYDVILPNLDEQREIGQFFSTLDNLITLHQRKLELLKVTKKSMLKKMFPKDGQNVPEIRFAGFTDAWEQRKLSEETNSIDTGKSKFSVKDNGLYEILGSTSVIGYDNSYDYEGDFLLTARVGANAGELYRHSGKVKISDNTVFIQGENLDFTFYMLMNFNIKKLSFGTGQPLVKASELKELKLMLPKSNEERNQIGTYFSNLDNLITLHQRELDLLKDLKKSMLQQMFI